MIYFFRMPRYPLLGILENPDEKPNNAREKVRQVYNACMDIGELISLEASAILIYFSTIACKEQNAQRIYHTIRIDKL